MGDAQELEETRRDLAHQDVLGGVPATEAAPGDDQQGREAIHQRQGRQRVQAGAEPRILHDHHRSPPAEPGARGQPDRDVLADRRNPGGGPIALERPDEALDQRAGHAGVEVEALTIETSGEVGSRQELAHRWEVLFSSWMNSSCLLFIFFTSSWYEEVVMILLNWVR
jgi:hypothetical protein